MPPYMPAEHCPQCGTARPYNAPCAACDEPGKTPTLPSKHPKWTKSERHLYGGQAIRLLGEVDTRGNLLVELMSGPLTGERRWFSPAELGLPPILTGTRTNRDPSPDAPESTESDETGIARGESHETSVQRPSGAGSEAA